MMTAAETKRLMVEDPKWWKLGDEEKDAVFAGVIERCVMN